MRDRLMERLVILPFSVGCISEASVAASVQQPRRSKADAKPRCKEEDDLESLSGESMKNSFGFMVAPKPPNSTTGIHKIVKGFKNISQLFVSKEDMEEMEREMEMEIGCPTDVKHVTHIGWDGCSSATATTSSPVNGWDNLITPDRLLSLPSPSLEHFRLSGPAHAHAHHPTTLLNAST